MKALQSNHIIRNRSRRDTPSFFDRWSPRAMRQQRFTVVE
jgi:hypothetical protein